MNKLKAKPVDLDIDPAEVDRLYVELVKQFYDRRQLAKARAVAVRLERILTASAEIADSIRGEEIRSLIAELQGDYAGAIHAREAEIRKILELHALAANSPMWDTVAKQYDHGDVSDRLDLLAMLYDRSGDTMRALAVLRESQRYCASHRIPFDGQDLFDELTRAQAKPTTNGVSAKRKRAQRSRS